MKKLIDKMTAIQIINRLALIAFIVTAFFSYGHHQSDEHYQVLEFAQYKMDKIDGEDLPWEFGTQMRPSLQPYMALVFIKACHAVKINNPFVITTLFRLLSAVFIWYIMVVFNKYLIQTYFKKKKWLVLYAFFSFFLWYVPYISVRFSSENFSGAFLLLALYLLLAKPKNNLNLLLLGLFLGIAFLIRYQAGLAIAGIFFWIIYHERNKFLQYWPSLLSFVAINGLGVLLDSSFYGKPVFAPYNYYYQNIVEDKASNFGVDPFWQYIAEYLYSVIPPLSLVLLIFFVVGCLKLRKHVFVWALIPYLLVHFLIAHKEMRFLFPVNYIVTFISVWALTEYFDKRLIKKYQRIGFKVIIVLNFILIPIASLKPANEKVVYYKYIYNNLEHCDSTVMTTNNDFYEVTTGLKTSMYTPKGLKSYHVPTTEDISQFLLDNSIDTCFYVYRGYRFNGNIEGYSKELVYSIYPDFIENLPFYDKISISTRSIYLLHKIAEE